MVQSNYFFLRSYVRQEEYDLTQVVDANAGTIPMIQGEFRRGPTEPTYVAPANYYNKYGQTADPQLSFAWDTAACVIRASSNVLINRVTNEAKYAGFDVVIDDDAVYGQRVLGIPFTAGTDKGYDKSGVVNTSGVSLIKFAGALVALNEFEIEVTDGQTIVPVSVVFSGDHNATMQAIATSLQSAIQTFSPDLQGTVDVLIETSSITANRYTLVIRMPNDASLSLTAPTITSGATQTTVELLEAADVWLGTVFAENPGVWAENYGGKISGIDQGLRSRYRLTFSGALVADNVIDMYINGVAITQVPFATDSDTTMANLATAIAAHPDVLSATVETVIGAINNDRSIVIVANNPGPDTLNITAPVITGGTSQPVGVSNNILKGIASSGALNFEVYSNANVNYPVETYQFSLFPQVNGRGEQIYFDNVVNQGSGASLNVRFVGNPELNTAAKFEAVKSFLLDTATTYRSTITWLNGGDDGLAVTSGQMISALNALTDRIRYPMNLALSAGYTDVLYMQALDILCETRGDATAILDMPVGKQGAQDAYNFRMFELNIDSSCSAIYTPNCQITDLTTSENRYIPPSGPVAAAYLYNDAIRNRYAAPAGLNRGPLRQVRGLLYEYTPEELELMNPVGINTIVNKKATGPTIMSEETLQFAKSALSSVHIRRTLNDVKTTLADGLEYSLFEPNTESTRFNVVQLAESVLAPATRNEGLYDYLIKCDDENNTPDVIDQDVLVVDIYVKPVRAAKGIILRSFITRTGISFSEVVATVNI